MLHSLHVLHVTCMKCTHDIGKSILEEEYVDEVRETHQTTNQTDTNTRNNMILRRQCKKQQQHSIDEQQHKDIIIR